MSICEGTRHCRRRATFTCEHCELSLCDDHGDKWTASGPGTFMHRRDKSTPRVRVPRGLPFVTESTIYGIKREDQAEKRRLYEAARIMEAAG